MAANRVVEESDEVPLRCEMPLPHGACGTRLSPLYPNAHNYIQVVWVWIVQERYPNGVVRAGRWMPICECCFREMIDKVVSTSAAISSVFFLIELIAGDVHCNFF